MKWNPFSKEELIDTIEKCNNFSIPGLDKLSQRHLKKIIKDIKYFNKFIDITNIYIDIGYWPLHFKVLIAIIILKPNKESYGSPKTY